MDISEDYNFYDMLGVNRDATPNIIAEAAKRLQRLAAPESSKSPSGKMFTKTNAILDILLDEGRRKDYDEYLETLELSSSRPDKYGQTIPSYMGAGKKLNEDGGPFLPQLVPNPDIMSSEEIIKRKKTIESTKKIKKPRIGLLTKLSSRKGHYFKPNKTATYSSTLIAITTIVYYIVTSILVTQMSSSVTTTVNNQEFFLFAYYLHIATLITAAFFALRKHTMLEKNNPVGYGVVFLVSTLSTVALWMLNPSLGMLSVLPIFLIMSFAYTLRGRLARTYHTLYNYPLDIMEKGEREFGIPGEGIINLARQGKRNFTNIQQQAYGETLTGEMLAPLIDVYPNLQIIHDLHIKSISNGHINHAIVVGDKVLFIASKLYEPAHYSLDRWGNLHKLRINGIMPEPTHRSLSFGKSVDFAKQHSNYARMLGLIVVHPSLPGEIIVDGDEAAHIDICPSSEMIDYIISYFADSRSDLFDGRVMAEVMRYYQPVITPETHNIADN